MSETLSIEQYNTLRAALPTAATKAKTRLASKAKPDAINADQFRHDHVDQDEHELQALGIEWFNLAYPRLLLYAIPNAAKRSFALANRLRKEGLKRGIPDLHLAHPSGEYHGLYIETKTTARHSKPSDDQLQIHAYLRSVGYAVAIPTTFEQFQAAVNEYLNNQ